MDVNLHVNVALVQQGRRGGGEMAPPGRHGTFFLTYDDAAECGCGTDRTTCPQARNNDDDSQIDGSTAFRREKKNKAIRWPRRRGRSFALFGGAKRGDFVSVLTFGSW